jgi:hypothetical protein
MIPPVRSRRYVNEAGERIYGVLAQYAGPAELFHACEKVRDAGYTRWDSFSPFPIHDMEEAMGIRRTRLPLAIAAGGALGAGLALLMQFWMSGSDYPLMKQGKPFASWEPFVPITFELGILLASFTALLGMLAFNGLPRHYHPLMKRQRFLASSDDAFFICIEAGDPRFDPDQTRRLLELTHPIALELVEE